MGDTPISRKSEGISDSFIRFDKLGSYAGKIKPLFTEPCEQNRLFGGFYSQVIQRHAGPSGRVLIIGREFARKPDNWERDCLIRSPKP